MMKPADLIQQSRLNGIKSFLKDQQARNTIAATASKYAPPMIRGQQAVDSGLRDTGGHSVPHGNIPYWSGPSPSPGSTVVPNAGLNNTPAPLPTEPGDIDPPTLIPPLGGPTQGGPQSGPQNPGNNGLGWGPGSGLPNAPYTSFGYNPVTGNASPTAVPTFWGPGTFAYNPNGPQALPVPFDTGQVARSGSNGNNQAGGIIGGNGGPYQVTQARTPDGHNANWWVL
jgi:hypothetical protein